MHTVAATCSRRRNAAEVQGTNVLGGPQLLPYIIIPTAQRVTCKYSHVTIT